MKNFDVLIIGGGISGCAIARELSRWQLKIALIEKNNDICEGTTKANSAIVHPGHNVTSNTLMAKYNVAGSHIFESICKELTVPFQQNGGYNVAFSTDDLPKLQALYKQGIKNGIQNMQILSAEELHKREPNLTTNVKQALYTPSSAITCPYELTIGYAENAAQNGVQFLLEQKVKLVQKTMDGWQILTDDNQIMKTKIVVNAAGLYADILNNQVSKHHFQILPKKGEYELFDKKFDGAFHSTIFQMPGPMGKGILISPTVDGTIILGPTATEQQSRDDKSTTAEELEKLRKLGQILWPKMPRAGVITSFAGLRAHTTVGDFILGEPDDAPNFYNIAGIESPGLTSAPAIAQDYAKRIAERLQAPPNSTFTPIRKKAKPFRLMTPQERQAAIAENPQYGNMICRCEQVTEAEIYAAIHTPPGARTIDGIKRRTRAGMGRCQSGFCLPKILKILADQQKLDAEKITKDGFHSNILIQNQNYNGP
ncbi:MAG: NAD(P)/FAD-dependent oxidoreductase, partial [Lentisphaeria bacterium]